MFVLSEFITENLIAGVRNGSFTRERANILAVDYTIKGVLTTADVERINEATMPEIAEPVISDYESEEIK